MCIIRPSSRRSSGSRPMPSRMASRGERARSASPLQRATCRRRCGRCRTAPRPIRCARSRPVPRRPALRRGAARTRHPCSFAVVRFSAARTISPVGRGGGARGDSQLAAHHHADDFVGSGRRHLHRADRLAVAQHRDAVADAKDLVHLVRDVNDGDAAVLQLGDQAEEPLRRIVEQRTGRLVHQDDARVHAERAGDGHQLHLADGERRDRLARAAVQPHLVQKRPAERFDAAEIAPASLRGKCRLPMTMFSPTREVGEQVELLVDDADAEALRVERAGDGGGRAVDARCAAIGPHRPGDNLRQGAFAGAVFAHQRVHFAGAQLRSLRPFKA